MPLALLTLHDRDIVVQTVDLHHVLLKSKAEMDQFVQGFSSLDVLDATSQQMGFLPLWQATHLPSSHSSKYSVKIYMIALPLF